jgi:hypothetical protein
VLLAHHPRQRGAAVGRAARGCSALSGFVDILIELHRHGAAESTDRRRQLLAWSRYAATPAQLVIELSADGTAYTALGNLEETALAELHPVLQRILAGADGKLTCRQIVESWPPELPQPDPATVWKWLGRAGRGGQVLRVGTGTKTDPHQYWLPEREQEWRQDPLRNLMLDMEEEEQRLRREHPELWK